jgi:multicomponent Na+:H+ antiporter subunit F
VTVVLLYCYVALSVSALLCVARLVRRGSLADRVLALDSLLIVAVVAIATDAARTGQGTYLGAMLVFALIAFIGTSIVARFIERRGAR